MFYLYTFTIYSVLCYGKTPFGSPFDHSRQCWTPTARSWISSCNALSHRHASQVVPRPAGTANRWVFWYFYVFFTIEFVHLHANMIPLFTSIACHCVSVVFKYICVYVTPSIWIFCICQVLFSDMYVGLQLFKCKGYSVSRDLCV